MYQVGLYRRVRQASVHKGMSIHEISRVYGLHRETVRKMLRFSIPPGYQRKQPPRKPKLDPFTGVIDAIIQSDKNRPKKQRHTAKRIFERLGAEHGYRGGYTIVKDYVRERRLSSREMFVPLSHSPGHGQADFGEALALIGGVLSVNPFILEEYATSMGAPMEAFPMNMVLPIVAHVANTDVLSVNDVIKMASTVICYEREGIS